MPTPFNNNSNRPSKPLRRIVTMATTNDPITGHPRTQPLTEQHSSLSAEGSVDTVNLLDFYKCGHATDQPIGGRCVTCGGVSCRSCQKNCICGAPLCPEHGLIDQKTRQILCQPCADQARRQRLIRTVTRFALSPFITFKRESES